MDLVLFLRAAGPDVVFLSVEMMKTALELAARIEGRAPGTQIVAVSRACQPDALIETMRSGIREFLTPPLSSCRPHWAQAFAHSRNPSVPGTSRLSPLSLGSWSCCARAKKPAAEPGGHGVLVS